MAGSTARARGRELTPQSRRAASARPLGRGAWCAGPAALRESGAAASRSASDVVAPGSVDHDPAPGQGPGAEGYKAMFGELRAVFPDLSLEVEHVVATDDELAFACTISGTHRGPPMGHPPTGRGASCRGMRIGRFDDEGRLVERWGGSDELGMLRQLGLVRAQR
ncbi:ester cyclase [Streptomyces sp. NPDC004065]|uniref:ester cyclase n=1 Tax=Streptomyces sp. NPDC004065 TaxID=3364689 RepID=UPI00384BEBF8